MASTAAPSRTQLLRLYRQYLSTSQSFASYNFRTYFLRRSRDMFRAALLPPAQASVPSPFSKAADATTPAVPSGMVRAPSSSSASSSSSSTAAAPNLSSAAAGSSETAASRTAQAPAQDQTRDERIAAFYKRAQKELDVLRRAAIMNRLYQGEQLVVERPQLIIGGGGAGVEASVGGGGQPV